MTEGIPLTIARMIRAVAEDHRTCLLTDHDLLRMFTGEQREAAFHAVLRRHGPMVLGVCRGVLCNEADAEDAFQATFLTLASKASTIRKTGAVGSWLYGVAYRAALKARVRSATRQRYEAAAPVPQVVEPDDMTWREVRQVLHRELADIPERYRAALVLCYLEGRTQVEAAAQLGVATSTLKERLERGRSLLRTRLVRCGLGPAAVLIATAWPTVTASAALPPKLMACTVDAARVLTTGQLAAPGVIPAKVAALMEGAPKVMVHANLKLASAVLLAAISFVGSGLTRTAAPVAGPSEPPGPSPKLVANAPSAGNPNTSKAGETSPRPVPPVGLTAAPSEGTVATKAVQGLIDEYTKDQQGILDRLVKAETDDERDALRRQLLILGHTYAPRLLDLAEKDPASGAGLRALLFLLGNADTAPEADKAVSLFVKHHLGAKGLLAVAPASCEGFGRSCSPAVETLLHAVLEQPKSKGEAGQACFALGKLLRVRAQVARELKGQQSGYLSDPAREAVVRMQAPQAKALAQRLRALDPEKLETESERYLERVVKEYGNGRAHLGDRDRTLGELAKSELYELRELAPGKNAPEVEGQDLEGKALKLSDYRGKVVVLTFWGSWCPACMKMVPAEKELAKRLAGKPFALVGVNSDADRLVAKEAARDKGMTWRSFWDESPGKATPDGPIATRWNLGSWPTTYVIDHRGVIQARFTGPPDPKVLDRQLDDLVREVGNP